MARHLPIHLHLSHGAYYFVSRVDGRVVWRYLSRSRAEAMRLWAELEDDHPVGSTVAESLTRYERDILPDHRPETQKSYRIAIARLRHAFGEARLDQVRPMHVAQYLDAAEHRQAANRDMRVLSLVFRFSMRWGWCDFNPCVGVRRHPTGHRERYLTDAELAQLRQAADPQWRCILDLALLTALRRSDLAALRLSAIQPEGLVVETQKTGKRLCFEWTPALREVVERARGLRRRVGSLSLFATRDGTPYSRTGWEHAWQRLRARAGLAEADMHFHDLRARALTDAAQARGLDYAQALGGHASRDTTEGYVRARDIKRVRPLR